MNEHTTARLTAASMPTPETQVAALRAIDHDRGDWDADNYLYYTDAKGHLWKGVLRHGYVRKAHSGPAYGDSEMSFGYVDRAHGPLARVNA